VIGVATPDKAGSGSKVTVPSGLTVYVPSPATISEACEQIFGVSPGAHNLIDDTSASLAVKESLVNGEYVWLVSHGPVIASFIAFGPVGNVVVGAGSDEAAAGGAGAVIVGIKILVAIPIPDKPVQSLAIWYVTGCVTVPKKSVRCTNVTLPVDVSTEYVPSSVVNDVNAQFGATPVGPHKRIDVGTRATVPVTPAGTTPGLSLSHGDRTTVDPCTAAPVSS
jgi:hypothetical protein